MGGVGEDSAISVVKVEKAIAVRGVRDGTIAAQDATNLTFIEPVNNDYLLTEIALGRIIYAIMWL
ncbi:hypothetical protein [Limnospira maxima]|uniref:hypothetical protein n=1 Tax=Limnospira TaxID=2596745 RepID=UPI00030A4DEA|nr:hypothetical protein [Limnospira maxima]MDC0837188.1 hypothetical protein [Limnoraphis robusta]